MKTMTATEVKTHFCKFLEFVQRAPFIVTKKNRPVGVMFSMQTIEDTIWGEKARSAHNEGYFSELDSDAILKRFLRSS